MTTLTQIVAKDMIEDARALRDDHLCGHYGRSMRPRDCYHCALKVALAYIEWLDERRAAG